MTIMTICYTFKDENDYYLLKKLQQRQKRVEEYGPFD